PSPKRPRGRTPYDPPFGRPPSERRVARSLRRPAPRKASMGRGDTWARRGVQGHRPRYPVCAVSAMLRATIMLAPGQTVPDVSLVDADGNTVRLRDLLGEKVLVLYFYPKDDTPGCTAQACGFRDAYEDFVDAGAQVVGVSHDGPASHQAFAQKHRLPFRLLSDPDGSARRAFGVKKTLGLLPGRATFVID